MIKLPRAVVVCLLSWPTLLTPCSGAQADPLKIVVRKGEGAVNILADGTAVSPSIVVRRNGSPVSGAVVNFTLPASGVGATFPDGTAISSATTGEDGIAVAAPMRPVGLG